MAKIQHCSNVPTEQIKKSFSGHLIAGSLPTGSATITPKLPPPDSLDNITNNSARPDNTGVLPSNYSALPHNTGVSESGIIRNSTIDTLDFPVQNNSVIPDNTGVSKIEFENFDSKDLFHLRDISGVINSEHRVQYCGKIFLKEVPLVTVKHSGKTRFFHGVTRCGSVWICPVCSFRLQIRRQNEIAEYIERQKKMERKMYFLTLTVRHFKKQTLQEVLKKVKNAWNELGKARQHKPLFKIIEYIATVEITYTYDKNGWHPHYHILLTEIVNEDISKMIKKFIEDWCVITGATKKNQKFKQANNKELAKYIAKWDIAKELSQSFRKNKNKGVTYWQMLKEPDQYKKQIAEYGKATKGRRTLQQSKGIKLKSDKTLFDEMNKSDGDLLEIQRSAYKEVIKLKKIYKSVLENAHNTKKILSIFDDDRVRLNLTGITPRIEFNSNDTGIKSKLPITQYGASKHSENLLKSKIWYEKEFPELIQASGSPETGSPRSCMQKKRPVLLGAF